MGLWQLEDSVDNEATEAGDDCRWEVADFHANCGGPAPLLLSGLPLK